MKKQSFSGFLPETIDFLWELRFNNNKEWFDKNRERYQRQLKEPMDLFALEMYDRLQKMDSRMNLMYSVSRINRDIRFSKNKAPYKEHRWASFRAVGTKGGLTPEFFFDLSPEGYCYGMGFYDTTPVTMKRFREKIDANPSELERLIQRLKKQKDFVLMGDSYKRKFVTNQSEDVMEWYQKKNIALIANHEIEQSLFQREILDEMEEKFAFLLPYYFYFLTFA